jgi:hypothetical protein
VEALDRIVASPESPGRKHLLCECVQAYAPLEDDQRMELNSLLQQPQRLGVWTMAKTWTEKGEERGILKGQRKLLWKQLQARFPTLTEEVKHRLEQLPEERLEELAVALLTNQSLRELGLAD